MNHVSRWTAVGMVMFYAGFLDTAFAQRIKPWEKNRNGDPTIPSDSNTPPQTTAPSDGPHHSRHFKPLSWVPPPSNGPSKSILLKPHPQRVINVASFNSQVSIERIDDPLTDHDRLHAYRQLLEVLKAKNAYRGLLSQGFSVTVVFGENFSDMDAEVGDDGVTHLKITLLDRRGVYSVKKIINALDSKEKALPYAAPDLDTVIRAILSDQN